ncbi:hypothetical protein P3T37_001191 [Kitasatospora sp. MAA4]|nr:hypothetical protein [Kitasatospora sp. MAA4]
MDQGLVGGHRVIDQPGTAWPCTAAVVRRALRLNDPQTPS